LGRFAVRDMKQTVAVGVVKQANKKIPAKKWSFEKLCIFISHHLF
jgi:hypothetical protein